MEGSPRQPQSAVWGILSTEEGARGSQDWGRKNVGRKAKSLGGQRKKEAAGGVGSCRQERFRSQSGIWASDFLYVLKFLFKRQNDSEGQTGIETFCSLVHHPNVNNSQH